MTATDSDVADAARRYVAAIVRAQRPSARPDPFAELELEQRLLELVELVQLEPAE